MNIVLLCFSCSVVQTSLACCYHVNYFTSTPTSVWRRKIPNHTKMVEFQIDYSNISMFYWEKQECHNYSIKIESKMHKRVRASAEQSNCGQVKLFRATSLRPHFRKSVRQSEKARAHTNVSKTCMTCAKIHLVWFITTSSNFRLMCFLEITQPRLYSL